MDTTNSGPTPPDDNRAESLSETTLENSTESASPRRMNRRDFMDVLGRTTLVGAAFSVSLIGVGCGAGGSGIGTRLFIGIYEGVLRGINGNGTASLSLEALANEILSILLSINDPTRGKTRSVQEVQLTGTYNKDTGAFDTSGELPDGTDVRVFGNLPNTRTPSRTSLFRLEYLSETYTGSIGFTGQYDYDDYEDDYDDSIAFFSGHAGNVHGGDASVSFDVNSSGKAEGFADIYDPTRAKATITVTRGKTRKATYVALLSGVYNLNNRQFNLVGLIGTGETVVVSGTAVEESSTEFPFTLRYNGADFTGTMQRFDSDDYFDDYFYDDFYYDDL